MARTLSNAAKLAIFAQTTPEVFVVLLTLDHESFTEPMRFSSDSFEVLPDANVRGMVSRGEEFIYAPFMVELPNMDDTGQSRARISIDNIDRRVVAAIRNANSAVDVTIEIVLASAPDDVEVSIDNFKLEGASYDALTVSGELSVEYFDLEPFPSNRFTPANFPGIF